MSHSHLDGVSPPRRGHCEPGHDLPRSGDRRVLFCEIPKLHLDPNSPFFQMVWFLVARGFKKVEVCVCHLIHGPQQQPSDRGKKDRTFGVTLLPVRVPTADT